jgi:peptidyl-prolyl cis-trans isomerase SurA
MTTNEQDARLRRLVLLPLLWLWSLAMPALAQDLFAPVVQVNDKVVTQYEVDQRARFMTLLRAPGDPYEEAVEVLIDERLQLEEAARMDLVLTEEQLLAGQEEFAARANLSREEFIGALAGGGVEAQTFRDFVAAGLLWREVVRSRFAPQVRVSDVDIDRALSADAPRPDGIRVLYSEIILPANTEAAVAEAQRRAAEIATYTTPEAFSQAARAFSVAPSRSRGGRVDWVEVANLPPVLAQALLALAPGQVSQPLPIPNAIALFQLRGIEDGEAPLPGNVSVDYALYRLPAAPAGPAEAARLDRDTDTCNDLYSEARGLPPERLERITATMAEIPGDVALELARLDAGETALMNRGGALVMVMLCSRTVPLPEDVTRDDVRARLQNQRLQTFAEGYLAELRANAILRYP